jgi:site-specific DNA recombinase
MEIRAPGQNPQVKPVGIWVRVSTEDQAKGESPEHHEHRARMYADVKGWRVREVYRLEGVSGKAVMGHSETERMLSHVRSGHISGLIFSKLARLARSTRDLLDFADLFREHEADLISLQEAIDTSTPAGRLFFTVVAAMAQWEREEISERVAASVPIRAKLGKSTGGAAPFGFEWKDRRLTPNPEEAAVRRLMYDLFLEHRRTKTTARILNERGYRTRDGAKFSHTTVGRLLQDPTAKGLRRANYTKSTGDRKHWVLKPRSEWVEVEIDPIVPVEIWNQVNAIFEERRRKGKPPGRRAVQLFAGVLLCHCGQKMYVPSESKKYVCPKCRNKIATADLESTFQEQLKAFFFDPEEVAKYVDQADEVIQAKAEALNALEADRQRAVADRDKVYRAYMADQLTVEAFGAAYRPLDERVRQIDEELPRLQGEVDFLKIEALSRDEVLAGARDLYARWPQLPFEDRRAIVEQVVEEVVVGKDDVSIHLLYLPPAPDQNTTKRAHNFRDSSRPRG